MDDRLESGRTLEALRRKNLEGKKTFIDELRRQKNMKSVSLLLEILCDESWYLRELAVSALVESGDIAVDPLHRMLKSGLWYTRAATAEALGRIGFAKATPDILELFDEPNRTVRESAARATRSLLEAGGESSVKAALSELPADRRADRMTAIAAVDPELAARLTRSAGSSTPPPEPEATPRMTDTRDGGGTATAT